MEQYVQLTPEQSERVGQAILRRRVERGFRSARSLSVASGLDYRTITHLEAGRRDQVSRSTLAIIESILEWPPGHLGGVIKGGGTRRVIELRVSADAPSDLVDQARKVAQATFDAYLDNAK